MDIVKTLMIVEIVISAILILIIVLQPKEGDTGILFGGGFADEVKRTKRGAELFLHNATIAFTVFWVAIAIAIMLLNK
ncbi:preprotein translocase subunit SecG [Candidatus Dojkabacteria bacterium]|nr:preprotein translocase subunit SecG [Candidatus Dojkabacteria bacterium]